MQNLASIVCYTIAAAGGIVCLLFIFALCKAAGRKSDGEQAAEDDAQMRELAQWDRG